MSGMSNKIMASRSMPRPNAYPVHFFGAIRGARSDYADRRRRRFHRSNLHGRGMCSKQTPVGQIKCVLLVACGMIRRCVERIKTMPLRFNVRTIRERKAHLAKDCDGAIEYLRQGMQRSALAGCAGK